jgi:hypothetical protein
MNEVKYERTIYLGDLPYQKGYPAVKWLTDVYGTDTNRWRLRELAYVDFRKERDATLFLLNWGSK